MINSYGKQVDAIQCLSYPELEIKNIFEREAEKKWYVIANKTTKIIHEKELFNFILSKIQEHIRK